MITVVMSAAIESPRQRVWRALTDPVERVAWDERLLAGIDLDGRYPSAGESVRWRYRLGPVQTVLRERHQVVEPPERLSAQLAVGTLRFEQLYNLFDERGGAPRTRLGMKVVAGNRVPLLGETVDRFEVRRIVSSHIDETLRALQKWCENRP